MGGGGGRFAAHMHPFNTKLPDGKLHGVKLQKFQDLVFLSVGKQCS